MALKLDEAGAAYLESVRKFADEHGVRDKLEEQLEYLGHYACHQEHGDPEHTQCVLTKDFAPQSFYFLMMVRPTPEAPYKLWFNGGLILHGAHDRGGDGGAPTFSVNLNPVKGLDWSVHT